MKFLGAVGKIYNMHWFYSYFEH